MLELVTDSLGIAAETDETDVVIANVFIRDVQGALCIEETGTVTFSVDGPASLAGPAQIRSEAGIGSTVLRLPPEAAVSGFELRASYGGLSAVLRVAGAPGTAIPPGQPPVLLQPA